MHARSLFLPLVLVSLVAIVAAACGGDDDGGNATSAGIADRLQTDGANTAGDSSDGAGRVALTESGAGGGADPAFTSQAFDRKIIFTAGLDLEVEDVARAFNEVSRIASGHGGVAVHD